MVNIYRKGVIPGNTKEFESLRISDEEFARLHEAVKLLQNYDPHAAVEKIIQRLEQSKATDADHPYGPPTSKLILDRAMPIVHR